MGQYDSLPSSLATGDTGKLTDLLTVYDGLKASDYFVPNTGSDMRATLQTAINDAYSDGGAWVVLDSDTNFIGSNGGGTDTNGDKYGLLVPNNVNLVGQGQGTQRSGGEGTGANNAATELENTATPTLSGGQKYHLISAAATTSPAGKADWRGSHFRQFHLEDTASHCDALLTCCGGNGFVIDNMSFGQAGKSNSKCLWVRVVPYNGEPTQYGRVFNCNFWATWHGVWVDGNNPDWEVWATQSQHEGGASPRSGATGYYIDSNAWRIYGGETQMYDIGIHLYGGNGRAKHFTLNTHHFEGRQDAATNAYDSMLKMTGAGPMYPLILAAEYANPQKYTTPINVGSGVTGAKFAFNRVRDSRWIASAADSLVTDNGSGTTFVT